MTFAAVEQVSGDIEPWAETLRLMRVHGHLTLDQAHWAVKLYNAFDTLEAAFGMMEIWPTVDAWARATTADRLAGSGRFMPTQERRGLRGGRVVQHLNSYCAFLAGMDADPTLRQVLQEDDPGRDFDRLTAWMREVWGVGRQSAFEWAEFCAKVCDFPVDASHGQLWESEGPRRSLQRIYGNLTPDRQWLDDRATENRSFLAERGVPLSWLDWETVICDFNVMRDGRYYPGRHLAALREEIDLAPPVWGARMREVWPEVAYGYWADIAPGIDPAKKPIYRDTGRIVLYPS